jgi:crossover junction endodeoxyribonuclease RuvC
VVLAEADVPVTGYANNVVKRAVTGAGRAGKEGVHRMVKAILGLAAIAGPLDASDALALAVCHANRTAAGAAASGSGGLAPSVAAAIERQRASERARSRRPGAR